jgi:hypothetical protein
MRGLALATLFLGLCLAKPDEPAIMLRLIIFLITLVVICAGL